MVCFDGVVSHLRRWNEVNPIRVWFGLLKSGSLQGWWDTDALVRVWEDGDGSAKPTGFMDEMYMAHYEEIGDTCSVDVVLEKREEMVTRNRIQISLRNNAPTMGDRRRYEKTRSKIEPGLLLQAFSLRF